MPKRVNTPQAISIMTRLNRLSQQMALTPSSASQLILTIYIQEAFLVRLLASDFVKDLDVGGSQRLYRSDLLQGLAGARPSRDIDFHSRWPHDEHLIRQSFKLILGMEASDGVIFDKDAIDIKPILVGTDQQGLAVRVDGFVGVARATLWCDLSFGAPLDPGKETLVFPRILYPEEQLAIASYPTEAVLAGKIAALLKRGNLDSRSKDLYDLWFLASTRDFEGKRIQAALEATCTYQNVPLDPEAEAFSSPAFLTNARQLKMWEFFTEKMDIQASLPTFAAAVEMTRKFYGPVLRRKVQGKHWNHTTQRWEER